MKALIFTERLDDPCYRYRIEAYLPALAEQGLAVQPVRLERGAVMRTRQLLAAGRADVVILQRKLMSPLQTALLRCAARRLVFDLDDALFVRHGRHPKGPESWKLAARFWATMRAADLVIVGNEYLAQRAARHVPLERIRIVPTCVDPDRYSLSRHENVGAKARLVWIGQACTLQVMESAVSCLSAAGRRLPGLGLRLICDEGLTIPDLAIELCRWSSTTEGRDLAEADIGISWLPDNPFNRGKCGLKVLQYMAAGLPVVANPVGVTPQLVLHGRTGFLASTPQEWAEAVARLAGDPELRRRMGAEGRRLVEQDFNVRTWAPRLAEMVAAVARGEEACCCRSS